MGSLCCRHTKAMIYKELILLKNDKKRLFTELFFPMLLGFSFYFSFTSLPIHTIEGSSNIEYGYESSSEPESSFSPLYPQRNFTGCVGRTRFVGIVSKNASFLEALQENLSKKFSLRHR